MHHLYKFIQEKFVKFYLKILILYMVIGNINRQSTYVHVNKFIITFYTIQRPLV